MHRRPSGSHAFAARIVLRWLDGRIGTFITSERDVRPFSAATACTAALFAVGSMFWLWQAWDSWAGDALVYRAGAAAFLAGADPWSAGHGGWSFAALPLTVFMFVPGALLPEAIFVAAWQSLTIASAVVIVRRLRLPWWWLLFPPLTIGVILGNPAIVGLAALLAGVPVVGLVLRPHLVVAASRRTIAMFGALFIVSIVLMPGYLTSVAAVMARYAIESGAPINLWGSPGMVVAGVAVALLATVDRREAAWLVLPAIGPSIGWYGFTMILPVASLPLAVATSLPIHGLGAWVIAAYSLIRFLRVHPALGMRIGKAVYLTLAQVPRTPSPSALFGTRGTNL